MKFTYGFLLWLILSDVVAQSSQRQIDSLRTKLETAQGLDRIKSQYYLATLLVTIDTEESERLSTEALQASRQRGFDEGIVNASIVKATLANVKSDLSGSKKFLEEAISLATEMGYEDGLSKAHTALGSLYLRKGEYALATESHLKALKAAESLGQADVQMINLMNVGLIKQRLGALDEAGDYFLKALKICEENDLQYRAGQLYINLGVLEYRRQNLGLSIDYNRKALDIFRAFGDRYQEAICLQNLGFAEASVGKYREARAYYDQVVNIRKEIDDQRGLAAVYLNMARLANSTGRPREARQMAELAMFGAQAISNARMLLRINDFLSSYYEAQGNARETLRYFRAYSAIKDSLNEAGNQAKIAEMTAEFEFENQQQQLRLSQEQLSLSENRQKLLEFQRWMLILLVVALLVIGTMFVITYRLRLTKLRMERKLLEEQKINSDLKQERLVKDMELQAIELRTFAEQIGNKNELINQFKRDLNALKENPGAMDSDDLSQLASTIDGRAASISLEEFRLKFNEVHPAFVSSIINEHGYLTQNEVDLCIFLKVNLTYKDIAQIQSISYDAVKKSIQRLYKKFNFNNSEELRTRILTV